MGLPDLQVPTLGLPLPAGSVRVGLRARTERSSAGCLTFVVFCTLIGKLIVGEAGTCPKHLGRNYGGSGSIIRRLPQTEINKGIIVLLTSSMCKATKAYKQRTTKVQERTTESKRTVESKQPRKANSIEKPSSATPRGTKTHGPVEREAAFESESRTIGASNQQTVTSEPGEIDRGISKATRTYGTGRGF